MSFFCLLAARAAGFFNWAGSFFDTLFSDKVADATWALALATVGVAVITANGIKRSLRTDALARFTTAWDCSEVRQRRKRFATWVLQHRDEIPDIATSGVADVMDFFEDLGTLLRPGRLDKKLVWQAFADASVGWWLAIGEKYALDIRKTAKDKFLYSEYGHLVKEMQKITRGRSHEPENWTAAQISTFLLTEKNLFVGEAAPTTFRDRLCAHRRLGIRHK